MKVQKETKPDNTQHRYGWLGKHSFEVGFGLIIIVMFVGVGDIYMSYHWLFNWFISVVAWSGLFLMLRGIYFAIKRKVKK